MEDKAKGWRGTKEEFEQRLAAAKVNEDKRRNNLPHFCFECLTDHSCLNDCKRQESYEYGRYI